MELQYLAGRSQEERDSGSNKEPFREIKKIFLVKC